MVTKQLVALYSMPVGPYVADTTDEPISPSRVPVRVIVSPPEVDSREAVIPVIIGGVQVERVGDQIARVLPGVVD